MDGMDRYREILTRYSVVREQQNRSYAAILASADAFLEVMRDQERLRPPSFNIFFALGHAYREVSTHSAMLAHLLDPAGGHAQGPLFLHRFLDIIQRAAGRQRKRFPIFLPEDGSRWQCRKEVSLPHGLGQADILLRGPGLLIVVENKVYASDQKSQLSRYWEFASIEAQNHDVFPIIVYLSPDGRAPTDQSIRESPRLMEALIRLSYHEDIHELIQSTAELSKAISVVEVLRQYATLVRRLA